MYKITRSSSMAFAILTLLHEDALNNYKTRSMKSEGWRMQKVEIS